MSKALGSELPQELRDNLSGRDVASKWSQTIPLVTIDGSGFPHFAILSYGEIMSTGPSELRIGLYPGSSTTKNIEVRSRTIRRRDTVAMASAFIVGPPVASRVLRGRRRPP